MSETKKKKDNKEDRVKMKDHVIKRGKNSYSFVIAMGKDDNGKRKQKWVSGFRTKKEAELAYSEMLTKVSKGEYIEEDTDIVYKDFLETWITDCCQAKLRPKTLKTYQSLIDWYIIPSLGNIKISMLTAFMIQHFYTHLQQDLKLAASTVRQIHVIIHQSLDQAVIWHLLARNEADNVIKPKLVEKEKNVLNPDQVRILLDGLKGHSIYPIVLLAVNSGMRRSEILGLCWSDLDMENSKIRVAKQLQKVNGSFELVNTKTKNGIRTVPVPSFVFEELSNLKEEQEKNRKEFGQPYNEMDLIFCKENGQPYDPDYISRNFARLMKNISAKYSIPDVTFHALRHTNASIALENGENIKSVSLRLGHDNVKTTLAIYCHSYDQKGIIPTGIFEKLQLK